MMDVVVINVLVNYGIILSRFSEENVVGILQLNKTYSTSPVLCGEIRTLYHNVKVFCILIDLNNSNFSNISYRCVEKLKHLAQW